MTEPVRLLLIWLGSVSLLTFFLFGWDKLLAKRHCRRVPEAALLGAAPSSRTFRRGKVN